MEIAKIAMAALVCVPLVALVSLLFAKLVDEIIKKK